MLRVLSTYTALYGMTVLRQVFLLEAQRLASRYAQLLLHQVHANHLFRYRMLHLQTGVHLQEVEVMVLIHQELYGASTHVVHSLSRSHRLGAHLLAQFVIDEW